MTHKQIYGISNTNQLVITLPEDFQHQKEVLINIDEIHDTQSKKIELMKEAANDPLYLSDLEEVNNEFAQIEHETV